MRGVTVISLPGTRTLRSSSQSPLFSSVADARFNLRSIASVFLACSTFLSTMDLIRFDSSESIRERNPRAHPCLRLQTRPRPLAPPLSAGRFRGRADRRDFAADERLSHRAVREDLQAFN